MSKMYKVIKLGLAQRDKDRKFVEREVGDLVEVSDEAVEYLVAEGYVEEVESTSRKRRER